MGYASGGPVTVCKPSAVLLEYTLTPVISCTLLQYRLGRLAPGFRLPHGSMGISSCYFWMYLGLVFVTAVGLIIRWWEDKHICF